MNSILSEELDLDAPLDSEERDERIPLQIGFVRASALLPPVVKHRDLDGLSASCRQHSQPPTSAEQPSGTSLSIPTPPCSQQRWPISQSEATSSNLVSQRYPPHPLEVALSNDITALEESDSKLLRILAMVKDMANQCRVCWVSREVSPLHVTFRCPTKACSGSEWKEFKFELKFPRGVICYFCFALFRPPFNHTQAPPGTKQSPELCEHPDALKELVYLLYRDQSLRGKIFSKLGVPPPTTLRLYKQYITKMQVGGILGAYKVVDAYIDVSNEVA